MGKIIKFLNCKIFVKEGNFFPRIETEFWVKKSLKKVKSKAEFLDIFSGTGCIGIAILKNKKKAKVTFADIDKEAIENIEFNLKLNKIEKNRYSLFLSDIFENLGSKKYDYIFANPPYVAKELLKEVSFEVLFTEKKICWYGGKKGIEILEKFLEKAKFHLKKGGKIFFEFDFSQKEILGKILKEKGYKKFKFFKDQFKKWRFAEVLANC
jgi:release factor glutamine methyltransferase